MTTKVWSAGLVIALVAIGCGKSNPGQAQVDGSTPTSSASSAASASPSGSSSASAAASGSASSPTAGDGWSGDYTAKKATIEQPEKVKDVTHKKDPGDKNVGPGKIMLSVVAGTVTGTATGALGDQLISGTIEGKALNFSLFPKNAAAPDAMTGTGVGEVTATGITGTLRCTGPDAVAVREASFELKSSK